jgi:group I intron endonuclease
MHVYMITNEANDKIYVGQHAGDDLAKYFKRCAQRALNGANTKPHLYNAIRKHGIDSFTIHSLVRPADKSQMDALEIFFIRTLATQNPDSGYNIASGGSVGMTGVKATAATRAKMSASRKGKAHSKEWNQKIGDAQRGRTLTAEHILALKAGQRGKSKYRSPEHCKKISENKKLWWENKRSEALNGVVAN